MRILDAHLHINEGNSYFNDIAGLSGQENTADYLLGEFKKNGIVSGIIMGNSGAQFPERRYPDGLFYCVGVKYDELIKSPNSMLANIERHLTAPACVGIKFYPGYDYAYIYDNAYDPVYALARKYNKPVAVHTGLTASSGALLKYAHPLTLDEAATKYPDINFIMCHFGCPWYMDAAAVIMKNKNVYADLSGLFEYRIDVNSTLKSRFCLELQNWLGFLNDYERIMFGTDWPLADYSGYIKVIKAIIPVKYHEAVFFNNANTIYSLGL